MSDTPIGFIADCAPLKTWDVLVSVGFREDPSEQMRGFSFDFGNFKLWALPCMNRWFVDIVLLTGVLSRPGRLTDVQEELPANVESREMALAYLASALDRSAGGWFQPAIPTRWLDEGRTHKYLVPWERALIEARIKQTALRAAPRCHVDREWLKVALRKLRSHVSTLDSDSKLLVTVVFDGEAISFRCAPFMSIMPASGNRWSAGVQVPAALFSSIPPRLKPFVEVTVWESHLVIGASRYAISCGA